MNTRLLGVSLAFLVAGTALGQQTTSKTPAPTPPPAKPTGPAAATLTAKDILSRATDAYGKCSTYSDHGDVRITLSQGTAPPTVETKTFSTAFSRPDAFRFEFHDNAESTPGHVNNSVIWTDSGKAKAWWTFKPQVEEFSKLGPALAAADGLLGSAAIIVPQLLMPRDFQNRTLAAASESQVPATEHIGAVDCYKLEAKLGSQPVTLWIDRQSFLVLRLSLTRTLPNTTAETVATFVPDINAKIPAAQLTFTPPAASPPAPREK